MQGVVGDDEAQPRQTHAHHHAKQPRGRPVEAPRQQERVGAEISQGDDRRLADHGGVGVRGLAGPGEIFGDLAFHLAPEFA